MLVEEGKDKKKRESTKRIVLDPTQYTIANSEIVLSIWIFSLIFEEICQLVVDGFRMS